jgi:hypothetical protein
MLGHGSAKETLETYADLYGTDLDALADVLNQGRAAALEGSTTTVSTYRVVADDRRPGSENVPSTQTAPTG